MAIAIRLRLTTDEEGLATYEYGEYQEGTSAEIIEEIENSPTFSGCDWSCKFDSRGEVGDPYIPMFDMILAYYGFNWNSTTVSGDYRQRVRKKITGAIVRNETAEMTLFV